MICQKIKKNLRRKLTASFREAVSNNFINLFSVLVRVAPDFVTAIKCFSPPLKQKLISSLSRF